MSKINQDIITGSVNINPADLLRAATILGVSKDYDLSPAVVGTVMAAVDDATLAAMFDLTRQMDVDLKIHGTDTDVSFSLLHQRNNLEVKMKKDAGFEGIKNNTDEEWHQFQVLGGIAGAMNRIADLMNVSQTPSPSNRKK